LPNGFLTWTPLSETPRSFIVQVTDSKGNWTQQSFTIPVIARVIQTNPPSLSSIPTGFAFLNEEYVYQIDAVTYDGSQPIYSIDQASHDRGIDIDENGHLSWIPNTSGTYEITITINDGSGGFIIQTFVLDVVARPVESNPPTITSSPTGPAYVGQEWTYTVIAVLDGNTEGVTLWLVSENGEIIEQIDPSDNTVRWTPTSEGNQTFIIRALGQDESYSEQRFTITAIAEPVLVRSPVFISVPTSPAYVGERYEYNVTAQTFDGTTPQFSLDETSQQLGITINSDGRLTWIPATTGDTPITIFVKDGSGNEIAQAFILAVVTRPVVTVPPTITSKPTGPAYVDEAWNYNVTATATDGGAVKFYLVTSDGETIQEIIDGNLSITWETAGYQALIIRAIDQKDSNGAWSEQKFTIQVVEHVVVTNDPPVIRSVPNEQIRLGNTYSYKLNVFDPNGDNITFSLAKSPQGATLSQDGLLSWNPSQIGQYEFELLVSDGINDPAARGVHVNNPVAESI
jgi:hypothetical protein